MFKSILPSRRVPSTTDFQMVTPPLDNGKENWPDPSMPLDNKQARFEKPKKRKGKEQAPGPDSYVTSHAFEKLLVSVRLLQAALCPIKLWTPIAYLLQNSALCTSSTCTAAVHCSLIRSRLAQQTLRVVCSVAPEPRDFSHLVFIFWTSSDVYNTDTCDRMSYRYPTTCARNWLLWTQVSKPPSSSHPRTSL